jgi:tRNA A37 threonylcarbamoyladenosine dehydratase
MNWKNRTELFAGPDGLRKLEEAHILVVGLGGVGAYAAESLCRAGIGTMTIVDSDNVELTNLNRQLPSMHSTIGLKKSEVMANRLKDINPDLNLTIVTEYLKEERITSLLTSEKFDFLVDAIDTIAPKVHLIAKASALGIPVVSSMGAGGKDDPEKIQIKDISKSFGCKLAKITRRRLSLLGIKRGVTVVFSPEKVEDHKIREEEGVNKKSVVGTISYMPAIFGLMLSSVVIREVLKSDKNLNSE